MTTRVVIYTRISLDRTGGGLGVQRQEEDCRKLADDRGWAVVEVYTDNDVSAFSGKLRKDYRKMLADIASGEVDKVVTWHTDRLHRSPAELEEYIEVCERAGVDTVTVQAGELDLSTASGKLVARMLGAAARHESEHKAERVRRARQQAAEKGEAHGKLGYGYAADKTIDVGEAAIIREIAERVIAHETLYSIAQDLNEREIPTPGGRIGRWRSVTIRQTIMRAALAGWREWKGGARGKPGGHLPGEFIAKGDWQPILSRETVERIRALLLDPHRRTSRRQPVSLLTGVLRCGLCGAPMSSAHDKRWDARRYVCAAQPGLGRCGGISIAARPVDQMVSAAVVQVLAGSALHTARRQALGGRAAAERRLLDARHQMAQLMTERVRGDITVEEWALARKLLNDQVKSAEKVLSNAGGLSILSGVPSGNRAATWWANASDDERRVVVRALISEIVISPATERSRTGVFDARRVGEPEWRI